MIRGQGRLRLLSFGKSPWNRFGPKVNSNYMEEEIGLSIEARSMN